MREVHVSTKKRFCETRKCILIFLFLLIVTTAIICIVTFVDKFVREKQQYRTDSLQWWQKTIVYQIYPRSFQDSNGDGTGDLKGIIQRLDYFVYLQVGAIWLSPFYKSPMKDFGYDVQNYTEIAQVFGDMEEFKNLVKQAKMKEIQTSQIPKNISLGCPEYRYKFGKKMDKHGPLEIKRWDQMQWKSIKIIVDFVPNHTSDKSSWFERSRRAEGKYSDYYIWRDCKQNTNSNGTAVIVPPNNWLSHFGGSAWTWDDMRQKCYYHAYLDSQPDLNLRNTNVQEELKNVLRFWLDKGVSGFRVDAIKALFESQDTSQDEPGLSSYEWKPTDSHNLTWNFPEIFPVLRSWRDILDEYEKKDGEPRYMVTEVSGVDDTVRNEYYSAGTIPFNFNLVDGVDVHCGGRCIKDVIEQYLSNLGNFWPNFVFGSHDIPRVASRLGNEMVNVVNMLLLTLPGTPTVYYGEEIGMEDTRYSFNETKDPKGLNYPSEYKKYSRDPERSPMQWNDSVNAGFSTGRPWLHVNPNYKALNTQAQMSSNEMTTIKIFKKLAAIRQLPSFNNNQMTFSDVNDDIISYVRTAKGRPKYLVVLNFGHSVSTIDCSGTAATGMVEVSSANFDSNDYKVGKSINLHRITLKRGQGLIIRAS